MKLTIRERGQKVAERLKNKTQETIASIVRATGLSKSSVHRHQQAIKRRNQQTELLWLETETGYAWLKMLVLGVVYYFGIQRGVGCEHLSTFFRALHLDAHVGVSSSALRRLKTQMETAIIAYEQAQAEHCQPDAGIDICVGGDETFFGLPILVMVELASGYIFTEAQTEDRSYQTWHEQIGLWWQQSGWQCHFMVSDGARALVKLALEGLGCVSVADWFHVLRALSQPLGSTLARKTRQINQQIARLQRPGQASVPEATDGLSNPPPALPSLQQQQQALLEAQQRYHQALHQLTQAVHPFQIDTLEWQLYRTLCAQMADPLAVLSELTQQHGTDKAVAALTAFQQQIPALAQGIHAWWQWVTQSLAQQTEDLEIQQWVLTVLLPWLYWQQQADKTRQPTLRACYQQVSAQAYQQLSSHPLTPSPENPHWQHWLSWGQQMVQKYQRTTSAVEGRNGALAQFHQARRGFSPASLKVLTIIHNFDLKRSDGTTAAQRLFAHTFPDLFGWVLAHMGDLPMPRLSSKAHRSQSPLSQHFPA